MGLNQIVHQIAVNLKRKIKNLLHHLLLVHHHLDLVLMLKKENLNKQLKKRILEEDLKRQRRKLEVKMDQIPHLEHLHLHLPVD